MITFRSSAVFTVSALILSACTQTSPEPTQITIDPVMTKYDSDGGGGGCPGGGQQGTAGGSEECLPDTYPQTPGQPRTGGGGNPGGGNTAGGRT
ncbi:hypothetical protein FIU86_09335 [Roseovarius sp. THAF9]|uniref:hypothetical protein n=1 Tax=Roseovarius sp. THAF9 TaxID=2587847 RepID=UPI00126794F9|nr:hypothetical protein [Roseovarius sp. THAF9]QFT93046.1 hypothetical protein FIU86_09335 [Roseovarius sp. THAF9]